MQVTHDIEDTQTSPYCTLRIIFMGLGIPKIHQQSIAQKLRNVSVKTLDDFRADVLVCTHHVTPVFWVELDGESSGVHEVTEHDRELSTFRVGRRRCSRERCDLRGWLVLGSRLWYELGGLSDAFLDAFSCASPHESSTFVVSYWMHVEKFFFEDFEVLVIQIEAHLQGAIGHPSLAFEERDNLFQDVVKR